MLSLPFTRCPQRLAQAWCFFWRSTSTSGERCGGTSSVRPLGGGSFCCGFSGAVGCRLWSVEVVHGLWVFKHRWCGFLLWWFVAICWILLLRFVGFSTPVMWVFVVVVVAICGFFEPGDVGLCCGGCCDLWVTAWLFWWVAVVHRFFVLGIWCLRLWLWVFCCDLFERSMVGGGLLWVEEVVAGGGCGG